MTRQPSQSAFDKLSATDPDALEAWIQSGELSPGHLTYAAQSLGRCGEERFMSTLVGLLLTHRSPLVREGAVMGLSSYPNARLALRHVANSDVSPGVRAAAAETLEEMDEEVCGQ